jgi:Outer membrane protein
MNIKIITTICLMSVCCFSHGQGVYTLEKCKELALQNNVEAKNSQLSVAAAEQTKKEAFTKYFPSIGATGVGFKASKPMMQMDMDLSGLFQSMGMPAIPPIPLNMLENGFIGAVMATQPVFAGGQIINGNKLAKIGMEVSGLQKKMTDDALLLQVEQYFWQIVTLEEKLKTLAEAETLLSRAQQDVSNAYHAGLINKNDLLKVELKQNELESAKLKLNNGLKLSKMVLAQYVGVLQEGFEVDASLSEADLNLLNVRVDHEAALQQRAEYQLLGKSVDAAQLQLKMKRGENLPTVAVGLGYNYFNMDMRKDGQMDNHFGMAFATVSIPLSGWWGGSHAIKKQKINVQMAQNDRRNAEEMLLIQMQQCWNDLGEASLQVSLADKTIASALENVRLNSDYYAAGTALLTELLDAQSALQQARDQHTEALTGYKIKLLKYRQATGQY